MRILVTHPGKQHVHRLCHAIRLKGTDYRFCTNFWLKNKNLWLSKISLKLNNYLLKRYSPLIDPHRIKNIIIPELIGKLLTLFKINLEFCNYITDRLFDNLVSKICSFKNYNIVIGYEVASYKIFKKAKTKGCYIILDLAHIHYKTSEEIRIKYNLRFSKYLRFKKNKIKESEYQLADKIIVLSNFAVKSLISNGIPETKIKKINLGIDTKLFTLKSEYNTTKCLKLLYVGQVNYFKGVPLLIKLIEELNYLDISLTLIGNNIDGRVKFPNSEFKIKHYNFLPQNELVKHYQAADIFIMPSYLDSWGMVVLEAMACGTPVIVTENTGAKDVVAMGGGYIVPPNDISSLKEKILYLYENRSEIERVGKVGNLVAQQYTWDNYYRQVSDLLDEIKI